MISATDYIGVEFNLISAFTELSLKSNSAMLAMIEQGADSEGTECIATSPHEMDTRRWLKEIHLLLTHFLCKFPVTIITQHQIAKHLS